MISPLTKWHLRVSVTPNCNLRCYYCNPLMKSQNSITLNDQEIISVVEAAHELGIRRVHWTGGEPTLKDIVMFVNKASEIGYTEQVMTTNGSKLSSILPDLAKGGLSRVNLSLDTLNPDINKKITNSTHWSDSYKALIDSLDFFPLIKVNIVLLKENLPEATDFIRLSDSYGGRIVLKYIELTPNNPAFYITSSPANLPYVPVKELCDLVNSELGELKPVEGIPGDNPNCNYFIVGDTNAVLGYVAMPSIDYHCGSRKCRKLRINPFGKGGICISTKGESIKSLSKQEIVEVLSGLIKQRECMSDDAPCRKHYQRTYGYWRFGDLNAECR